MDLENIFTYHAPDEMQVQKMNIIRACAKTLATAIQDYAPKGADQTAAIRKVREAVMTANAAIVLKGEL